MDKVYPIRMLAIGTARWRPRAKLEGSTALVWHPAVFAIAQPL